jgi:hypothetical protein
VEPKEDSGTTNMPANIEAYCGLKKTSTFHRAIGKKNAFRHAPNQIGVSFGRKRGVKSFLEQVLSPTFGRKSITESVILGQVEAEIFPQESTKKMLFVNGRLSPY